MGRLIWTVGLLFIIHLRLSGQVCYQFSGGQAPNSPASFSQFVAQVSIGNPQALLEVSPGIYEGSFGGAGSTIKATVDQTTLTFSGVIVDITYFPGPPGSTLLTMVGANLSEAGVTIQMSGSTNLLPNGLPPSLPAISAWNNSANFTLVNGSTTFQGTITAVGSCGSAVPPPNLPSILSGGIVPIFSASATVESGEWISIYGNNLASASASWKGDFPVSLGGTSVTIDGRSAYLWFVSPAQINLQVPDDPFLGTVPVVVTTAAGSGSSTVVLAEFAPAFSLLDGHHVTGIITRTDGSGAYGGGTYDIIGPTGNSLGYPTVAARPGDAVTLFAVGLGPTSPHVPAGMAFSGSAPTTNPVTLVINNVTVTPSYSGETSAGLYQLNLTIPPGLGQGDVPILASVGGAQTQSSAVISLDTGAVSAAQVKTVMLSALVAGSASSLTGTVSLSAPAPSGGAQVVLSSNPGSVILPATVTVAAGAMSATFALTTATVTTTQTVIITATYGGASAQTALMVTPATANSPFIQLTVIPNFQPAGYPPMSTATFTVAPDPGNFTFTACIDGCALGVVLVGGTASNQGQTFTFNTVQPGNDTILFAGSSNGLLSVSSGSLTFTLSQTTSSGIDVLGNVTGTLTLTGSTPNVSSVTLSGPITGTYAEILP